MSEYHSQFSSGQLRALDIVARVSSCLSLTGSSFTIVSFISYPPLRKPVNRLAFSIAVANIFACLAYSWGRYPVRAGRNTAFCQTQGFFITWFVMTDPLLVTVMAFNVLLTVRTKRNAQELKKQDLSGICFAFTAPFIPALVFLIWRPDGRTVYGDATMWCWIAKESDILRLVEFYVPIWIMILISIFLFALSGKQILLVRKKVKTAKSEMVEHREPRQDPSPRDRRLSGVARAFMSPTLNRGPGPSPMTSNTPLNPFLKGLEPLAPIRSREVPEPQGPSLLGTPSSPPIGRSGSDRGLSRRSSSRFDRIHWKYAKFAFLCTIVLFITWVPISVNRIYNNFISPNRQIYGLYLASALCIPLHGFGNFVIYTTTSWTECQEFLTCSTNRGSRRLSSIQLPKDHRYRDIFRHWKDRSVDFGHRYFQSLHLNKNDHC
ncbi:uncharacterized protein Z518_07994 [Rhinocladiella mackenziei CBS 650.93]|uniref:Rhinocladiella mackenziei CBS 650.93 unplaced genomic scaffold supercont1.6, whole genome shotgun sequence n=1 Tax=Rhinocladiella mackenziei CBS 650.93 TaxID=1442369 RepID=A0A0D2IZL8_9EURO|nr:uncharacterized protein Z518_07994 [Rhinocladiella mackenziei CBS 650.93]KIX02055.1 hypothetical protein Z518_07994 [Rhinocladiella mackenziei CBS 650.93]